MQLTAINDYFSDKIRQHGASPQGVDWNGDVSQHVRFAQLEKLFADEQLFSLNDLGCGYGALYDYLTVRGKKPDYLGIDISPLMVEHAASTHKSCRFIVGNNADRIADYTVASGIFNIRLATPPDEWKAHIFCTLDAMRATSAKGFAFNCLTSYSDASYMRDDLYYADPCELFDHCKKHYSKNVALLHDYTLYDFTLLVRL